MTSTQALSSIVHGNNSSKGHKEKRNSGSSSIVTENNREKIASLQTVKLNSTATDGSGVTVPIAGTCTTPHSTASGSTSSAAVVITPTDIRRRRKSSHSSIDVTSVNTATTTANSGTIVDETLIVETRPRGDSRASVISVSTNDNSGYNSSDCASSVVSDSPDNTDLIMAGTQGVPVEHSRVSSSPQALVSSTSSVGDNNTAPLSYKESKLIEPIEVLNTKPSNTDVRKNRVLQNDKLIRDKLSQGLAMNKVHSSSRSSSGSDIGIASDSGGSSNPFSAADTRTGNLNSNPNPFARPSGSSGSSLNTAGAANHIPLKLLSGNHSVKTNPNNGATMHKFSLWNSKTKSAGGAAEAKPIHHIPNSGSLGSCNSTQHSSLSSSPSSDAVQLSSTPPALGVSLMSISTGGKMAAKLRGMTADPEQSINSSSSSANSSTSISSSVLDTGSGNVVMDLNPILNASGVTHSIQQRGVVGNKDMSGSISKTLGEADMSRVVSNAGDSKVDTEDDVPEEFLESSGDSETVASGLGDGGSHYTGLFGEIEEDTMDRSLDTNTLTRGGEIEEDTMDRSLDPDTITRAYSEGALSVVSVEEEDDMLEVKSRVSSIGGIGSNSQSRSRPFSHSKSRQDDRSAKSKNSGEHELDELDELIQSNEDLDMRLLHNRYSSSRTVSPALSEMSQSIDMGEEDFQRYVINRTAGGRNHEGDDDMGEEHEDVDGWEAEDAEIVVPVAQLSIANPMKGTVSSVRDQGAGHSAPEGMNHPKLQPINSSAALKPGINPYSRPGINHGAANPFAGKLATGAAATMLSLNSNSSISTTQSFEQMSTLRSINRTTSKPDRQNVNQTLLNGTKSSSASQTGEAITSNGTSITWKKGKKIGEGSFGIVYQGMNTVTGELLAIKQLALADGSREEVVTLQKEIDFMEGLDHANIVRYVYMLVYVSIYGI